MNDYSKGNASRFIMHMDLDCFYVSVERLKNPSLQGVPVVVGSKSARSVISSASYEARQFGVRSAMPGFEAAKLCPHLIFCKPDFEAYSHYSKLVFEEAKKFAPVVEQVSIDEAYLDLTGCEKIYPVRLQAAKNFMEMIQNQLGLPLSIGIGTSRMIAKIASDSAKPAGCYEVLPGGEAIFMENLPVGRISGIGKKTEYLLNRIGINLCKDLLKANKENLRSVLGNQTESYLEKAQGIDLQIVESHEGSMSKSIGAETTFDRNKSQYQEIQSVMMGLCEEVSFSLRNENLFTRTIQIKLRDGNFHTITRAKTLSKATNSTKQIQETVTELFKENFQNQPLRLVGVSLRGFESDIEKGLQLDFFSEPQQSLKDSKVDQVKDLLRTKFGSDVLLNVKTAKKN